MQDGVGPGLEVEGAGKVGCVAAHQYGSAQISHDWHQWDTQLPFSISHPVTRGQFHLLHHVSQAMPWASSWHMSHERHSSLWVSQVCTLHQLLQPALAATTLARRRTTRIVCRCSV